MHTSQNLITLLQTAVSQLPAGFRTEHARLWSGEHLERLAERLVTFQCAGVPAGFPLPHFDAECTPLLSTAFAPFVDAMTLWEESSDLQSPVVAKAFAQALQAAGCKNLLLLLGQRLTPASLTDARAIPPSRADLLAVADRPHSPADPLTVLARALAKHVHRSPDAFWGVVTGSAAQKNESARTILRRLLEEATWSNCFGHFKHEVVYEVRVATGHGARWGLKEMTFIGFLEPFVSER